MSLLSKTKSERIHLDEKIEEREKFDIRLLSPNDNYMNIEPEKDDDSLYVDTEFDLKQTLMDNLKSQRKKEEKNFRKLFLDCFKLLIYGVKRNDDEKKDFTDGLFDDKDFNSGDENEDFISPLGKKKKKCANLCGLLKDERSFSNCFGLRKNQKKKKDNKKGLGWFTGVFIPVVLDCFGVILFLRVPMLVGNLGFIVSILMFTIGYVLCILSIQSASAIVTNGEMKAGGSYFMISRILGSVFGGAIGVMIYLANIFGTTLYILGFVDSLLNPFPTLGNIFGMNLYWSKILIATILLLIVVVVCIFGASLFEKTTSLIFAVLMISILSLFFSFLFLNLPLFSYVNAKDLGYTGFKLNTILDNMIPHFSSSDMVNVVMKNCSTIFSLNDSCLCNVTEVHHIKSGIELGYDVETGDHLTFQILFGILFPACTGVLAGTNLSGQLKNPSSSISKGSIAGTIFTYLIYVSLIIVIGCTTSKTVLVENYMVLIDISVFSWIVRVGIFAATISSSLTSFYGCSEVLKAYAKDNLIPFLGWFSVPKVSIIASAVFVEICLFLGHVNVIAPFVTIFFVFTFSMINLACLMLTILRPPNFRPKFKFFSKYTCLIGFVLGIFLMFFVDWINSLISFFIYFVVMIVIFWYGKKKHKNWGSITTSLAYYLSNKILLKYDTNEVEATKYWRFKCLHLVSNPRSQYQLMNFVANISMAKGGLCIFGNIKVGDMRKQIDLYNKENVAFVNLLKEKKWKCFHKIMFGKSVETGCTKPFGWWWNWKRVESRYCGFWEKMSPFQNVDFKSDDKIDYLNDFAPLRKESDQISLDGFMNIIKDILSLNKSIIIARNFQNIREDLFKDKSMKFQKILNVNPFTVDVWILISNAIDVVDHSIQFAAQLGWLIINSRSKYWKFHKLRFMFVSTSENELIEKKRKIKLKKWLSKIRIDGEIKFVKLEEKDVMPKKIYDEKNTFGFVRSKTFSDGLKLVDEDLKMPFSYSVDDFRKKERSVSFDNLKMGFRETSILLVDKEGKEINEERKMKIFNKLIIENSVKTNCIIATLIPPPSKFEKVNHVRYYRRLNSLTKGVKPIMLVYSEKDTLSVNI